MPRNGMAPLISTYLEHLLNTSVHFPLLHCFTFHNPIHITLTNHLKVTIYWPQQHRSHTTTKNAHYISRPHYFRSKSHIASLHVEKSPIPGKVSRAPLPIFPITILRLLK